MMHISKLRYLQLATLLLLCSTVALAAEIELTPFYGYTFGGQFDDLPGIEDFEIRDGDSYGATFGFMTSAETQVEVLWSHQDTDLRVNPFGPFRGSILGSTLGMTVDQYHIGGLYLPYTGDHALRPFVSASVGVTVFNPDGLNSEGKFSFSLGGGLKYYVGERLGFRLQARWTPTYVNSTDVGVFCDPFGFCYVLEDSNFVNQVEASAGVIIKF